MEAEDGAGNRTQNGPTVTVTSWRRAPGTSGDPHPGTGTNHRHDGYDRVECRSRTPGRAHWRVWLNFQIVAELPLETAAYTFDNLAPFSTYTAFELGRRKGKQFRTLEPAGIRRTTLCT